MGKGANLWSMTNAFLRLVRRLHEGEPVERADYEGAMLAIDSHPFSISATKMRLKELLQSALDGDLEAHKAFLRESEGLVAPTPQEKEDELRDSAAELPGESWKTPLWQRFQELAGQLREGQACEVRAALKGLERDIDVAWEGYSEMPISESEVTQETILGHGLLQEALENWLESVDLLRAAEEEPALISQALESAEWASRLTAMVQVYTYRVHTS